MKIDLSGLGLVRRLPRRRRNPLPIVEIDLGPSFPGWVLHVIAPVLAGGVLATVAVAAPVGAGLRVPLWWLSAFLVVWALWRPGHRQPLIAIAVAVTIILFAPGDDPGRTALWAAPLGYLGVRCGVWAAVTGWRARVEWRALARAGRFDALVVAVTLVVGAVALGVRGASGVLFVVGALALVGVAWLLARSDED